MDSASSHMTSDLDEVEEAVFEIIRNTTDTLAELKKSPRCDNTKLTQLAEKFAGSVGLVHGLLHSNTFLEPTPELSVEKNASMGANDFERSILELKELRATLDKSN